MRGVIIAGALFLLVGCASGSGSCVTVKELSPADQAALAAAVGSLPSDSPLIQAMGDYKRMRDESRVCQQIAR